jgi:hypothetical protein
MVGLAGMSHARRFAPIEDTAAIVLIRFGDGTGDSGDALCKVEGVRMAILETFQGPVEVESCGVFVIL